MGTTPTNPGGGNPIGGGYTGGDPNFPAGTTATGVNSPGNTTANQSTGFNQGFSQAQADQLRSIVQSLSTATTLMDDLVASIGKFADKSKDADKTAKSLKDKYKDWGNELKFDLGFITDMEEEVKKILDHQKKMAHEALKAKDFKELLKVFTQMRRDNDDMAKSYVKSGKSVEALKKENEALEKEIRNVKQAIRDSLNFDDSTKVRAIRNITSHVKEMSDAIGKTGGSMGRLKKDIKDASGAWNRLTGGKDRMGKYQAMGHEGERGLANYRAKMVNRTAAMEGTAKTVSKGDTKEARIEAAKAAGMGFLGSRIMANAAGTAPQNRGILTKAGMNVLARGEGSIMSGIGSLGAHMLEGGGSNLMALAGRAAPFLAVAELAKELFDKNQLRNRAVHEKLGGAGIYAGATNEGGTFQALANVRNNLNTNPFNTLGMGYEKNLAIAQQLAEAGLSTKNLANENLGTDQRGFANGSFGTLQRNVYAYGKAAGLDPSKTMAETIKLITQYRRSLESTEVFFVQINRDATRANITTSRYIQLIDEVNSHYDRSNKLLETTVDTMRLLSVTGSNTADDIKSAIDAVTTSGKKRSVEVETYLNAQIFRSPEQTQALVAARKVAQEDAIKNYEQATGETVRPGEVNAEFIRRKNFENITNNQDDPTKLQATRAALKALQQANDQLNIAQVSAQKARTGQIGQAAFGYTNALSITGEDMLSQAVQTIAALKDAIKKSGGQYKLTDILNGEKRAEMFTKPQFAMLQKALENNPEQLTTLVDAVQDSAMASVRLAQRGVTEPAGTQAAKQQQDEIDRVLEVAKRTGFAANKQQLNERLNTKEGPAALAELLSREEKTFDNMFDNSVITRDVSENLKRTLQEQAISKARGITEATTTTADIWANSFEWLFNKIATPLQFIAGIVAKWANKFGYSANTADEGTLNRLDKELANADTAMEFYKNEMAKNVVAMQAPNVTPDQVAKLKADNAAIQGRMDDIRDAQDTIKNPETRGQTLQTKAERESIALTDYQNPHPSELGGKITAQVFNPTVPSVLDAGSKMAQMRQLSNDVGKVVVTNNNQTNISGTAVTTPTLKQPLNKSGEAAKSPVEDYDFTKQ